MAGSLDYAKEWMRDGDRLLERAGRRVISHAGEHQSIHIEIAVSDFSRAAQMYLTGAVEYQQGREAVQQVTSGLDVTVELVEQLDGRLRSEAEAAWQSARQHLLPSEETRHGGLELARAFAETLRDRLAHAAPELFDRGAGPGSSRDPNPSRSR